MCKKLFLASLVLLLALAGNASAAPVLVEDFESYTDDDDLRLTWNATAWNSGGTYERYLDTAGGAVSSAQAIRLEGITDINTNTGGFSSMNGNWDFTGEAGIEISIKVDASNWTAYTNGVVYRVYFQETNGDLWRTHAPRADGTSFPGLGTGIRIDDPNGYGVGAGWTTIKLPFNIDANGVPQGGDGWIWDDFGNSGTNVNSDGIMDLDVGVSMVRIAVAGWGDEVNTTQPNDSVIMWFDEYTTYATGYEIVDDFESYVSTGDLETTWYDNTNAYPERNADQDYSRQSKQSIKIPYNDNFYSPYYTEVGRAPDDSDWTRNTLDGEPVKVLDVWFLGLGDVNNLAQPLYVVLDDGTNAAVIVHDDPNAAQLDTWQQWSIPLQDFVDVSPSLDLTSIAKIYIGLGDRDNPVQAASCTNCAIYIDNIELYPCRPGALDGDINDDCVVDGLDLADFMAGWLNTGMVPPY